MQIDKVSCLCLDKRYKLWPKLEEQVSQTLDLPMEKFICGDGSFQLKYDHIDGIKPPHFHFGYGALNTINNHYNAFLCHRKMVQRAIDEDRDNLLLLEDDAYLTDRFNDVWSQVSSTLDKVQWDICYLGWWMERSNSEDNKGDRLDLEELWTKKNKCAVEKVPRKSFLKQEVCALHGLLVNKSAFNLMANAPWGPMDSFLTTQFNNINAYYVWPKIIHVGPGYSNCEKEFVNRNQL